MASTALVVNLIMGITLVTAFSIEFAVAATIWYFYALATLPAPASLAALFAPVLRPAVPVLISLAGSPPSASLTAVLTDDSRVVGESNALVGQCVALSPHGSRGLPSHTLPSLASTDHGARHPSSPPPLIRSNTSPATDASATTPTGDLASSDARPNLTSLRCRPRLDRVITCPGRIITERGHEPVQWKSVSDSIELSRNIREELYASVTIVIRDVELNRRGTPESADESSPLHRGRSARRLLQDYIELNKPRDEHWAPPDSARNTTRSPQYGPYDEALKERGRGRSRTRRNRRGPPRSMPPVFRSPISGHAPDRAQRRHASPRRPMEPAFEILSPPAPSHASPSRPDSDQGDMLPVYGDAQTHPTAPGEASAESLPIVPWWENFEESQADNDGSPRGGEADNDDDESVAELPPPPTVMLEQQPSPPTGPKTSALTKLIRGRPPPPVQRALLYAKPVPIDNPLTENPPFPVFYPNLDTNEEAFTKMHGTRSLFIRPRTELPVPVQLPGEPTVPININYPPGVPGPEPRSYPESPARCPPRPPAEKVPVDTSNPELQYRVAYETRQNRDTQQTAWLDGAKWRQRLQAANDEVFRDAYRPSKRRPAGNVAPTPVWR